MAITKLNSLAIPDNTIVEADLSYPLTNFSSTGIDDNATSTAITIDSSENVGIGNPSPAMAMDIVAADNSQLRIDGSDANDTTLFMDYNGTGASDRIRIKNSAGDFVVAVTNTNEAMRIDSSGRVGIGEPTPDVQTHISSSLPVLKLDNTNTILSNEQTVTEIQFKQNDSTSEGTGIVGRIKTISRTRIDSGSYFGNAADLSFFVSGGFTGTAVDNATKEAMTIQRGTGRVVIPSGVTLGTSAAVATTANTLDDYEEGTWEPALIGLSSNPSVTYHADTGGFYIKIGRLVYVTGTVRTTAISGGSGELLIANLPFSISDRTNGDNSDGVGTANTNIWNGTSAKHPTFVRCKRNDSAFFIGQNSHDAVSTLLSVGDWGSACMMSFTIVYYH